MSFRLKASATFRPRMDTGQFIAARITPGVRASVQAATQLIVEEAKRLVPVDTGALKDSISGSTQDAAKTVVGTIVATEPYAAYVEYGTGQRGAGSSEAGPYPYNMNWPGMAPQPYLRPALDTTREAVRQLFASQIALELKR